MATKACPENAFRYNGSLCACNPGRFFLNGSCSLFVTSEKDWSIGSLVDSTPTFFTTVLPLESIRRITQSQAVLLLATLAALLLWLLFCVAVRFGRVDGGQSIWFRIRWWISRLDVSFATNHWLDDCQVVQKRQTELGGAFSVACWILLGGLLSALLYQIITKRSIEVHRVKAANAPDLLAFVNDLEFNITTISSMSCSNLRGLDTLVTGVPGFVDYRVFPLSTYANYHCYNTSKGPTISIRCNNCQVPRRDHFISWHFVDLPNDPATAVGFQFNLTAKDHDDVKHVSYVSGTLKSDSDNKPKTFRGPDLNILKIHLFPQTYIRLHNLKLIQPLFHDFIPGSSIAESGNLRSSLQSPNSGIVNTTLYISYLADYIVEIDKEIINGPVSFLADIGGLYSISLAIFLYLLWQCEGRFKKLRYEDSVMRDIRSRRRAQRNWDKLRKFVMYTWGPSNLDGNNIISKRKGKLGTDKFCGIESLRKSEQPRSKNTNYSDKTVDIHVETSDVPEATGKDRSGLKSSFEGKHAHSENGHRIIDIENEQ
ncbi:hypothetical protein J5N97_019875 [Dioscorea zingiberensis]|uniref:Uncharacterized protein n=1 Tax=Dioscorea zingiberensis TaxID=325984 RepID=A0A9D5CEP8_9LILI|nr:hypothetical protein J5N97_019875 [Dioscorea zingiberensis]